VVHAATTPLRRRGPARRASPMRVCAQPSLPPPVLRPAPPPPMARGIVASSPPSPPDNKLLGRHEQSEKGAVSPGTCRGVTNCRHRPSAPMRVMWNRLGGAVRAAVSASPLAAAAAATTFVAPVALRAPSPAGERQHAHAGSKRARRGCVTVPRSAGGHGAPVCACGRPDASPLLHPHVSELGCVRALRACMRAVLCVYVCVYVCDCTEAFWSRKPMSSSAQNRLCLPCTFTAKNTGLPPSLCAVCVCACACVCVRVCVCVCVPSVTGRAGR
jgi:hypothetical protein